MNFEGAIVHALYLWFLQNKIHAHTHTNFYTHSVTQIFRPIKKSFWTPLNVSSLFNASVVSWNPLWSFLDHLIILPVCLTLVHPGSLSLLTHTASQMSACVGQRKGRPARLNWSFWLWHIPSDLNHTKSTGECTQACQSTTLKHTHTHTHTHLIVKASVWIDELLFKTSIFFPLLLIQL